MFFDTREPAPLSVRWARVIAPLVMCFAYTVFRVYPAVHERIPLSELLSAGAMFAGLVLVAFLALGDLCVPRLGRYPAPTVEEEQTWPGWHDLGVSLRGGFVTAEIESFDAEALRAYFADVPANGGVMSGVLPNDAVTEELELLTHEYVPQHHTPARGFEMPIRTVDGENIVVNAQWNTKGVLEVDVTTLMQRGTVTGRIPAPGFDPFGQRTDGSVLFGAPDYGEDIGSAIPLRPTLDPFGQRTGGGRHALKDGE